MCRLLCVRNKEPFAIQPHLQTLAHIAENSTEYQGHGWGCAWLEDDRWQIYRDIKPIWEDDAKPAAHSRLLLVHARSAFRDEGIRIQNNMPFTDGEYVFIFNGELRGVRIREEGRIGAEKIFNYIKRFDKGDMLAALRRALSVIDKRTRYVRAMNLIMANRKTIYLASLFNENPGYFQMRKRSMDGFDMLCSEPYPGENDWTPIESGVIEAMPVQAG